MWDMTVDDIRSTLAETPEEDRDPPDHAIAYLLTQIDAEREKTKAAEAAAEASEQKRLAFAGDLARANAEIRHARAKLAVVQTRRDDVWFWEDGGCNHPKSISCPVVMSPETLRALVGEPQDRDHAPLHVGDIVRTYTLATSKTDSQAIVPSDAPPYLEFKVTSTSPFRVRFHQRVEKHAIQSSMGAATAGEIVGAMPIVESVLGAYRPRERAIHDAFWNCPASWVELELSPESFVLVSSETP